MLTIFLATSSNMNKALKLMLFVSAMFTLAAEAFVPLYAMFIGQIGGGLITAGQAYAVFGIFSGVLVFFISRWEDRVKHKEKLIVTGYGFKVLAFALLIGVTKPIQFFAVQAILGIGEAIAVPAFDTTYSKLLDQGKFATEWGLWEATWYIAAAFAGLIGAFIAKRFSFSVLFVFMVAVSSIGFFASLGLLRAARREEMKG